MKRFGVFCLLILLAAPAIAATLGHEDGMPKDWFGKRKVVDRFGDLTRVAIIHYVKDFGAASRDSVVSIGDPDGDGAEDAYALLGFNWNLSKYPYGVPYVINPSGAVKMGLDASKVTEEIRLALESWDDAVDYCTNTSTEKCYSVGLYNDNPRIDYKAKASISKPDYRNVITWGSAQPGVVAYSVIWYKNGEIVDADMVLNSLYKWGIADGNESTNDLANKFDIRNIVTHEAGHWTGLDDLYDENYSAMTMYGYSNYGEEIKRSLEPGDIAGAQEVYKEYR